MVPGLGKGAWAGPWFAWPGPGPGWAWAGPGLGLGLAWVGFAVPGLAGVVYLEIYPVLFGNTGLAGWGWRGRLGQACAGLGLAWAGWAGCTGLGWLVLAPRMEIGR